MDHSKTIPFSRKVLLRSKRLASGLLITQSPQDDGEERELLVYGESLSEKTVHRRSTPPQLKVVPSPISDLDDATLLQQYTQIAQEFLSSLPFPSRLLGPEDVEITDEQPVAAGGSADILRGKHGGSEVVVKAYRYYRLCDITQIAARFCNEVHVCKLLHGHAGVVPLVGVYSNGACPFGLVYKYMGNLDAAQHSRNQPNVGRVKLLTGVARCLGGIHDLGIVRGDFRATDILVDKNGTPYFVGLGNAHILPLPTTSKAEGGTSTDRLSRSRRPESTRRGISSNGIGITHSTKADDMLAFGFVAFEILTGRPPFPGMTKIAATYSMLNGDRPPQPSHHEVSSVMWRMIQGCWNPVASRRMAIKEAVALLEEELGRIATLGV